MAEYADRFVENRIDISVLPDLTEQHLKDLGIALGDRLKMRCGHELRHIFGPKFSQDVLLSELKKAYFAERLSRFDQTRPSWIRAASGTANTL
jgi:hypothetical protein